MTTNIKELLPCPFCNNDMSSVVRSAEGFCRSGSTLYVPCDCGAMGPEGKTIDDAIAAWNRRTPVEQLSAQTAEPACYTSADRLAKIAANPKHVDTIWPASMKAEGDVSLYTHPAKTEHPSLNDHQLNYVQECIERAKLLPVWDNVPHSLHAELDNIFRGVALLSAQRQDSEQSRLMLADDTSPKIPACQDSDKDAERWRAMREFCTSFVVDNWTNFPLNNDALVDRAIANGAPK